jgi:hypothetical protein
MHSNLMKTTSWEVWNYGKAVSEMPDSEIQIRATRAWDANEGDELRRFRAEGQRRGIRVI